MYIIFNSHGFFEMYSQSDTALPYGCWAVRPEQINGREPASLVLSRPPTQYHVLDGDDWVLDADGQQAALLAEKKLKINKLNTAAQAYIDAAAETDKLPSFEVQTWPLQAAEAQAWAADNTAATPVLDSIAAARGMDADKLKATALRKALAYSALSAHVAGQRQALQSKIEAAKTVAALDKIKIEFTAPPEAV